jgi:hypothetical protein
MEWLNCNDARPMLEFLGERGSARKFRLFACACVRRVWRFLRDDRTKALVSVAEQHADGEVPWEACEAAVEINDSRPWLEQTEAVNAARASAYYSASHAALKAASDAAWATIDETALIDPSIYSVDSVVPEYLAQADLLRDILGEPFRTVSVPDNWLAWNDRLIPRLAQTIYDNRSLPDGTLDVARLNVLADALEDAGCTNADILDHCRGPGPHVRGCWVVDLLIGKA